MLLPPMLLPPLPVMSHATVPRRFICAGGEEAVASGMTQLGESPPLPVTALASAPIGAAPTTTPTTALLRRDREPQEPPSLKELRLARSSGDASAAGAEGLLPALELMHAHVFVRCSVPGLSLLRRDREPSLLNELRLPRLALRRSCIS